MDLDDFWWQGSLAKDVYQHLFETERQQTWGTSAKCVSDGIAVLNFSLLIFFLLFSAIVETFIGPLDIENESKHIGLAFETGGAG